jgi:hypothetical protein
MVATIMIIRRRMVSRRIQFGGIDLTKSGSVDISTPTDPWTTNEKLKQAYPNMIRSHVWFDSLQRYHCEVNKASSET